jgi:hypothetical protein
MYKEIDMSDDNVKELFGLVRGLMIQVAKLEERLDTSHRMMTLWVGGGAALGTWAFWIFTRH